MVQTLNREYIKVQLERLKKHDTGKSLDILPFLANKNKPIKGKFNNILGEYIRNITGIKENSLKGKKRDFYISSEDNETSELIADEVKITNDDDRYDFVRFLNQYLFNQKEIKPIHPFLFNYIKVDKAKQNEYGKYARFMNEVLVEDNEEIKAIFSNKETEDILTELILNKLDTLQGNLEKKSVDFKSNHYQPLLPSLSKQYQEDMIYLSQFKDYFLTSFPMLTNFYAFMYVCQLSFKFEQFTEADFDSTQPLYFSLEWETVSKRRKVVEGLEGYKYIRGNSSNLFPHIHTISQLSHNTLNEPFDENEKIPFITYSELLKQIQGQGKEYEKAFLSELKQWIKEYSLWANVDIPDHSNTIPEAFKVLFHCLKAGTNSDVAKKYGENIEDLGSPFLKSRGNSGKVFNVKHDFLLLITAVSVKNKRMPLNELFVEFEKRGIAFDRYSKKEIITLFDNHNILDKKSDSGDAQYVKPILF
ncbi:DNA phosphorothioation-dependent restriction protein DptG [Peribacillus simplex]|uniref:DNA phosphorothioation-dependent restriction protein DptG n=1 Tax=Peribacillus simplex TaxID=1478 RepID=UPI002989F9D4|nr:DNA phosphorothioation-dependent restriction protein DptG [Peribacillus simplex]MBX9955709.1 DNA phosphorothioation-dependent restriction protein DptG [Peribacillus simplex]